MRTELTTRLIEKLTPKEKRYNVVDSKVRGFGIAVYPTGQKTFYHVRKILGRPERTTLGAFPDMSLEQARGKGEELNGKISKWKNNDFQGVHPLRKPKGEPTLDTLLTDYCDVWLPRSTKCRRPERAAADAKWMFSKYCAAWRNRKLSQIHRRDVIALHQDLKESAGPYSANRVLQLLRAMFNWAIHPDAEIWSGVNPAAKISLHKEVKRKRFLDNGQELVRLFSALKNKATSADLRDFVNLALWTGARKSDVLSMKWDDVKFEDNRLTVPDSKTGDYELPLTPEAIVILKNRKRTRTNGNPWVFPSYGESGHVTDLKNAWAKLLKRAKITNLRQHDLRRTLGSWQAKKGSSIIIIGRSLGHTTLDSTEVYSQVDLATVRNSMEGATAAIAAAGKKKPKLLAAANG